MPVERHPLLRWRMADDHQWTGVGGVPEEQPGPRRRDARRRSASAAPSRSASSSTSVTPSSGSRPRPTDMWNWTPAEDGASSGSSGRAGCPPSGTRRPSSGSYVAARARGPARRSSRHRRPPDDDAMKALLLLAARSHGVGTAKDLADYHRLPIVPARRLVAELAADGALRAGGGGGLEAPRASSTPTPCCRAGSARRRCCRRSTRWCGSATAPCGSSTSTTASRSTSRRRKRVHGYYVLPFLHDGRLVARVDLKADRQAGTPPRAEAPTPNPPGTTTRTSPPLVERLEEMAEFLGAGRDVAGRAERRPRAERSAAAAVG